MRDKHKSRWLRSCRLGLSAMALGQLIVSPVLAAEGPAEHETGSPIKHVIVIIGENRSFDHVFATYVPKRPEEKVFNLLSQGIIKLDKNNNALPGPNFEKAHQLAAKDVGTSDAFLLSPPKQAFPNDQLPAPLVGGPKVSFIPKRVRQRADYQLRAEPGSGQAVGKRTGSGLLSVPLDRRHRTNFKDA